MGQRAAKSDEICCEKVQPACCLPSVSCYSTSAAPQGSLRSRISKSTFCTAAQREATVASCAAWPVTQRAGQCTLGAHPSLTHQATAPQTGQTPSQSPNTYTARARTRETTREVHLSGKVDAGAVERGQQAQEVVLRQLCAARVLKPAAGQHAHHARLEALARATALAALAAGPAAARAAASGPAALGSPARGPPAWWGPCTCQVFIKMQSMPSPSIWSE